MTSFDLYALVWPTAAIFGATLAICFWVTTQVLPSILFAFVKAGVFLIYYGVIFDGTFTFLDDWTYLDGGLQIVHEKIGFSNLIEGWDLLLFVGRGEHFFYYLQNAYAIRLFGDGYYAPVALNIIITLLVAYFGKVLSVREFAFSEKSSRLLFFFLLVHPDIMSWSTVVNGKDVSVLLLHVTLLFSISLLFRGRYFWSFVFAVPSVAILFFLRFYVPLVFAVSLVIFSLLSGWRVGGRYFFAFLFFLVIAFFFVGVGQISYALDALRSNFGNPVFGFLRVVLMPVPFNTDASYAFLDFPALLHWMLIPFALVGVAVVSRMKTPFSRLFLIYLALFLGLYSVFLELQGPRHRVQLDFAIAILQFIGLSSLLKLGRARGSFGVDGLVYLQGDRKK